MSVLRIALQNRARFALSFADELAEKPTLQAVWLPDNNLTGEKRWHSYVACYIHCMKMRPASKKCRWYRREGVLLTVLLAAAAAIQAQTPAPHLEVATVRPSDPAKEHPGLYWRQPDGFKCEGTTLRGLISNAYVVTGSSVKGLIVGGPAWMTSQAFDVQVKVDPPTAARWRKLSQQAVDEERRSVLRELLAERFQLKLHREAREMPVYALIVVKGGSKLRPPVEETNLSAGVPKSRINFYGRGHMQGHFATLGNLARSLAGEPEVAGRPVVDKTGLTGQYDFTLQWASFDPGLAAAPTDPGEQGPSLFTALKEQLGLKLKPEKAQIEVIVVDSVENPSEN